MSSTTVPLDIQPASRRYGLYDWLTVLGAIVYLTLPVYIFYPALFAAIAGVPPLEGVRLENLRSLLTVVMPIGLIYLFAVVNRFTSLIDLTLAWRLAWVAPWLVVSWATGALEGGAALFIGSVDVGLPIACLAASAQARGLWPRLRAHFDQWATTPAQRMMGGEAVVGFLGTLALSAYLTAQPGHTYVQSFVTAVPGCYFLYLAWASKSDEPQAAWFALSVRALLIGAMVLVAGYGFPHAIAYCYAAFATLGLYLHGYNLVWTHMLREQGWSLTRWVIAGAGGVVALSLAWYTLSPAFQDSARQLAFNIHRQDLIIAGFAVLVGVLLADIAPVARLHAAVIAWLLPFSALWFTVETKMLANLGVGTPLHPSWAARGLAPVWGGSPVIDLTFWAATLFLTAITTTYAAVALLRYLPTDGWRRMAWHGVGIILVSALWMIASSSGLPAPVEALAKTGSIPPFLPGGDPIGAVSIHVRDLLLGMGLIAGGLLLARTAVEAKGVLPWTVAAAWWLSLLPKAWFHLAGWFGGA